MAHPALAIRGLTKRFGDIVALDDVDLEVAPGQVLALLGPNGAGKTTLIRCATGLARITAGRVRVYGHDVVADWRAARRLVGLVPQELVFDPFFTPHQSVMLQMGLMGQRPDGARADALLAALALADKRDARTRSLSGGMKRRLLAAKALAHSPRLLFLDEPTAGVDPELRSQLHAMIRGLRDDGVAIVLTTHHLDEAEALADRVAILHGGTLRIDESTAGLLAERRGVPLEAAYLDIVREADAQ